MKLKAWDRRRTRKEVYICCEHAADLSILSKHILKLHVRFNQSFSSKSIILKNDGEAHGHCI